MNIFSFYKTVVPLNSDIHRNLKFDSAQVSFSFARDTIAVLLAGVEFAEASREYPIVFIRGEDQVMRPSVLLGVRNGENLLVDEQGKWDAAYIPAIVRRYPFVLAEGDVPGQLIVCIDEVCPALNNDCGESLVDAKGRLEPRMNEIMQFMQNVQQEFARTELLVKQLDELGLFVPQGAHFDTPGGESFQIKDFYVIDEARFAQIAQVRLPELFLSGALALAYLHMASLGNMRRLLDRVTKRVEK
ncbi:MAG: SapC family protein [Burkholderiales bacterium]|nr:SapC family protein [Burkholderiales bacterium]